MAYFHFMELMFLNIWSVCTQIIKWLESLVTVPDENKQLLNVQIKKSTFLGIGATRRVMLDLTWKIPQTLGR